MRGWRETRRTLPGTTGTLSCPSCSGTQTCLGEGQPVYARTQWPRQCLVHSVWSSLAARKTYHSQQLYEQLVCFVMAYSFTDAEEREVCERTMMVPFVDLLNHHSQHHAELSFHPDRLQLVAVREIRKVAHWYIVAKLLERETMKRHIHTPHRVKR